MGNQLVSLWNDFSNDLLKYINSKVNDKYLSEDILQEVFVKVYKNIYKLEDQTNIKSWLFTITKNTIIDFYRKNKEIAVESDVLEHFLELESDKEIDNFNNEIGNCLKMMIYELPHIHQEAIELYENKGMKHKEIAEQLDITVSASKNRLNRAKRKLIEFMLKCCDFEIDVFGNVIDYNLRNKKSSNCKCG